MTGYYKNPNDEEPKEDEVPLTLDEYAIAFWKQIQERDEAIKKLKEEDEAI